jgi:hypothetical protein
VLSTAILTTLGLAAAGYGFLRQRFQRTQVSRASMEQAVADFRKGAGVRAAGSARSSAEAAGAEPGKSAEPGAKDSAGEARRGDNGKTPAAGVYAYRADGYYEADVPVLGKERRVLPKIVPGILVPSGECWELTHRYFEQHHWTGRFCRHPDDGLRLEWVRNKNEMFSMKTESRSQCEPQAFVLPGRRPGDKWPISCTSDPPRRDPGAGKVEMTVTYVGDEPVEVDGRPQAARRVRRLFSMKSPHTGYMSQDVWLALGSGMLLKLVVKGEGKGMGKFQSDYHLTLKSLTPSR